ncbi:MAG: hypothetical protein K2O01_04535 [Bacteroidales bacterium]|nr:hypothetical protein [Bacteroidales bacterium]
MKKLLLILALLAYVAISCEDKPNTLTGGDEPEVDTSADTCSIYIYADGIIPIKIYDLSSDEIDPEASVLSVFRHATLTMKDGSYATAIDSNYRWDYNSTFDTGSTYRYREFLYTKNLKAGHYLVTLWFGPLRGGFIVPDWGPNVYDPQIRFFYRDITLDTLHPSDSIILTKRYLLDSMYHWFDPLWFYEF